MTIEVIQFRCGEAAPGGAVLALDAFDGLHPGQVRVIEDARGHAQRTGAPLSVLSFEPYPRRLLQPHVAPFALLTRDQEIRILDRLGVSRLYILTFDFGIARMSHADFSRDVLHRTMGVRHVSASTRIAYGKDRVGDLHDLQAEGERHGFGVSIVEPALAIDGIRYSSSVVRGLIPEGRVSEVVSRLGRPFAIQGAVQHGAKLGRTIGFPTANIALGDYIRPAAGIYASVSILEDGRRLPSLSYIGRRPTVDDGDERLEVFLFDFDQDVYGQQVETALIDFLRPDECFPSLEAMQAQMEKDREKGRAIAFAALQTAVFAS